jgi:uncharacterized membrane protein
MQPYLLSQVPGWTPQLHQVVAEDIGRIAWNIYLALIPLVLSFWLFNQPRSRWFAFSTYLTLGVSFIIGVKRYKNGDILESIKAIIHSLWGVRAIFLVIAIGLILILMTVDIRVKMVKPNSRPISWWIGLLLFISFLPNAPYILTDIVHFYNAVRSIESVWEITLVIVPIYIVFIGIGWFAYVFSLLNVGKYLARNYLNRYINIAELSLHLLCAVGIYIGRFIRFNSWSLIAAPREFIRVLPEELIGKFPIVVMLITFVIIMVLYSISKAIIERPITNHP